MALNNDTAAMRSSRRANGSLLSVDRTPQSQSEEFFTDSLLDASKIPTPSPKKQPFHQAYKERRAIGNSRALKSAWETSARSSFSDSDGNKPAAHLLRPTKLPSPRRSPSPLRPTERLYTPPPLSRRHTTNLSPASPVEVSSPAHGLDETYKRIAEEEDIAAQEREFGDDEEYTDEMYDNGGSDYGRNGPPDDDSKTSDQNFESDNAYNLGKGKENIPLENDTVPTNVSGMSFLEGLTDQSLAAKLTPHAIQAAKDKALLEKAVQRQTPLNFKGAANGRSLADRLQRRNTSETGDSGHDEEPQSARKTGDGFQEPSPNIPKSWTKPKPDWMQKSRQRREKGKHGVFSSPGLDSSQVDWAAAAAADVPVPSIEEDSTPKSSISKNSSPAPLRSQQSLDRIRKWEMNDFTGQSLQVSDSPPVRPRTNVVDQIQQREIERLEKQAVTTNRLGQYRQRDPHEIIRTLQRGRSTSAGPLVHQFPTPEPAATPHQEDSQKAANNMGTPRQVSNADNAKKGEPIPNTPVIIYKSSSSPSDNLMPETRPDNDRQVSEEHLVRLARAMSSSPKPTLISELQTPADPVKSASSTPSLPKVTDAPTQETLIEQVVKENEQAAKKIANSQISASDSAEIETTPRANHVTEIAKTPMVIGAWTDTIMPDTVLRTIRSDETKAKNAQTPLVNAGGWMETPLLGGKRQSSALAPIPVEEEPEAPIPEGLTNGISKPREAEGTKTEDPSSQHSAPAPKSALTTLLARAKSRLTSGENQPENNDTLHLNDSTINSLEDLLTLDNDELTTLIRMGAESDAREQLIRDHLGGQPIEEAELLERLSGKLNALRTNIHDARKGIGRLESQVAKSPERLGTSVTTAACASCNNYRGDGSYLLAIHVPLLFIPPLFHTRRKSEYLARPTWLGWLTILVWSWYLLERAMGAAYAHPLYTVTGYEWPSESEPVFPWVLPTMLWRWGGRSVIPTILGPIWWLMVAAFRVFGQALGWTDGFVDDGLPTGHVPSSGNVLGAVEDALGMDADVFL